MGASLERYYARSASDRTDDWPFWFVADRDKSGLNVTRQLAPELTGYLPLVSRDAAIALAENANASKGN